MTTDEKPKLVSLVCNFRTGTVSIDGDARNPASNHTTLHFGPCLSNERIAAFNAFAYDFQKLLKRHELDATFEVMT